MTAKGEGENIRPKLWKLMLNLQVISFSLQSKQKETLETFSFVTWIPLEMQRAMDNIQSLLNIFLLLSMTG